MNMIHLGLSIIIILLHFLQFAFTFSSSSPLQSPSQLQLLSISPLPLSDEPEESYIAEHIYLYSKKFEFFYESEIKIVVKNYLITITNFKAIRQSMTTSRNFGKFYFKNSLYSFTFDQTITFDTNQKVKQKAQVIEHTFSEIEFNLKTEDRTFSVTFTHTSSLCSFIQYEVNAFDIFDKIKKDQPYICTKLSELVKSKIMRFVDSFPCNNIRLNFDDLLERLIKETEKKKFYCNFRLNETHRVTDYDINDLVYSYQVQSTLESDFHNLKVNLTYSVMNVKRDIVKVNNVVEFQFVTFGQKTLKFSKKFSGNKQIVDLFKEEIRREERYRIWKSEGH